MGSLSEKEKQLQLEGDHSLPSSSKVKNARCYVSTSLYVFIAWCLIKHRDKLPIIDVNKRHIMTGNEV
jgi:hypothetical protein